MNNYNSTSSDENFPDGQTRHADVALIVCGIYLPGVQTSPETATKAATAKQSMPPALRLVAGSVPLDQITFLCFCLPTFAAPSPLPLPRNRRSMDSSLATVVDRLKRNDPTLCFVDLRNDSLGAIGADGAALLADALKSNNVVTNINLGAVGIGRCIEVSYENITMHVFVGADGAAPLAEALKSNTTLLALDLRYNGLGPEGAGLLAEGLLKNNTTLQTLNLSANGLGQLGMAPLADALRVNTTLSTLILSNNELGECFSSLLACFFSR